MVLHTSNRRASQAENQPPSRRSAPMLKNYPSRSRVSRRANTGSARATTSNPKRRSRAQLGSSARSARTLAKSVTPPSPSDVNMIDVPCAYTSLDKSKLVTLPRFLRHPETKYPSQQALEAVGLGDTPLEYAQRVLKEAGPNMHKVLMHAESAPVTGLPKELEITLNDVSAEPPTHVLAVYCRLPSAKRNITLTPIHDVILAAHCANLPILPPSSQSRVNQGDTVTLPVIPLGLPSPTTFRALLGFLYLKRTDLLLAMILPCAPGPHPSPAADASEMERHAMAIQRVRTFAQQLAVTFTPRVLFERAMYVNGLWQNACALGVFDQQLWACIDWCWEVLLTALAFATGAPQSVQTSLPLPQ
ncbi:hypothetical protein EW146_g141 [Bondarzewia mesenterica]|uniref:Clp1-like protein n=1 Tax=Bondarzewia mesenterica TaxID=1095465 RepID=A0A4S4M9F1_9AGAM|nr:hypothetical protein EW146_g141 [Bondarzewia mesenterica]